MKKKTPKELILETLVEKSTMKQVVYKNTLATFSDMEKVAKKIVTDLKKNLVEKDVSVNMRAKGRFEFEIKVAGDILVFHMHTNVFQFDKSHNMWNTSYIKEDSLRSYCGMINIYNFLADSIKYNRSNDTGYLVARLFINKDQHYFVEGKRQLGFLYNDFINASINGKAIQSIIESSILYVLDFDLLTPSYEMMQEVTVFDIEEITKNMKLKTGKRLGFRFQADSDAIE